MGCALPEGATGGNIARQAALRAGIPVTAAAMTINRFCSSGLQAIAAAAQRIIVDGVPVAVAGGLELISLVQANLNRAFYEDEWLRAHKPDIYITMIETADIVARRYGISRERQDEYALTRASSASRRRSARDGSTARSCRSRPSSSSPTRRPARPIARP